MKKIKISGVDLTSDQLPALLEDLDLFPLLAKRLIERINATTLGRQMKSNTRTFNCFFLVKKLIPSQSSISG